MTHSVLAAWYGSADLAEAVERDMLGDVDLAVAAAKYAKPIRQRSRSTPQGGSAGRESVAQLRGEAVRQVITPAPRRDDGLVASALRSLPELQRAWGRAA